MSSRIVNNARILPVLSADRFPLIISLSKDNSDANVHGFGKCNRYLVFVGIVLDNMKKEKTNISSAFIKEAQTFVLLRTNKT